MRIMGAITPKAPFRVLIVSEQKSHRPGDV